MGLSEKTCTPCKGGISPLTKAEAQEFLNGIPEWALNPEATAIYRRFCFKDFVSSMAFAQRCGEVSEKEGHHPVLTIGWGYCVVTFTTNKIKGLHENDFIMAGKINQLFIG